MKSCGCKKEKEKVIIIITIIIIKNKNQKPKTKTNKTKQNAVGRTFIFDSILFEEQTELSLELIGCLPFSTYEARNHSKYQ